ncbi:hypothetical protein QOZ95_005287 [Paenibacillus brasilensis]|uniref:Uncharacterized protein n=1 Tax=Paenibacillus brasilensis TaxID=128574 RepID=A0ABU0L714_9BACL|nr:hypothetical protein [Paenibacillus brasilensis]
MPLTEREKESFALVTLDVIHGWPLIPLLIHTPR